MPNKAISFLSSILLMGVAGVIAVSCSNKPGSSLIILTEKPAQSRQLEGTDKSNGRYEDQCRIVSLRADDPKGTLRVLTDSFYSARAPQVSYDGRFMLFAGKRKKGDSWQIYEINMQDLSTRQITSSGEDCVDPVYLPGDRIAFSKSPAKDTIGAGTALFTCTLQGTEPRQITFHPHDDFAATVLADGRILSFSNQVYPVKRRPFLFVLRPDGTKGDLYYDNPGKIITGRVWENQDGRIFFIDADSLSPSSSRVACIHQNDPLHSYKKVSLDMGDFQSVFPAISGKLFVSYRKNAGEIPALYELDPNTGLIGKPIYSDPEREIVDVMVAEVHSRPRKLPSEVDMEVKTGLLMCQDINFRDQIMGGNGASKKATQIEVLGISTSLGIVQVEEDGSFYLKAMADMPVRIQTLDENGKIVNGPGAWLWLRPNERRGCIGCHENHEMAPENRIALAVKKPPVIIPIHIKKIGEKVIELE